MLAQIAAETRRSWVADPKKVKTSDFVIEVGSEAKQRSDRLKAKTAASKQAWFGAVGLGSDSKAEKKKRQHGRRELRRSVRRV